MSHDTITVLVKAATSADAILAAERHGLRDVLACAPVRKPTRERPMGEYLLTVENEVGAFAAVAEWHGESAVNARMTASGGYGFPAGTCLCFTVGR